MLADRQRRYVLEMAYVPEHSVGLMEALSGGEAFLRGPYLCFFGRGWLIVVGYPLGEAFRLRAFSEALEGLLREFNPRSLSVAAPELPSLPWRCVERVADFHYAMRPQGPPKGAAARSVRKASQVVRVCRSKAMGDAHRQVAEEFSRLVSLPPRVKRLLEGMPRYLERCQDGTVLEAWLEDRLVAYYVVDLSASRFSTYVIGCRSGDAPSGTSDLLVWEMVRLSREEGKAYIHLGLGVNEGIRRFKEKWGGRPVLPYQMGDFVPGRRMWTALLELLR